MYEARFENEHGLIRFGGGKGPIFHTTEIVGLGPPKKEFNVTGYINQAGQELISQKDMARVITISGDIISKNVQQEMSRIMKILYHPGILTVLYGNRKRSIKCRCTEIDDAEHHGRQIASTVIQFTCDNPYFTDDTRQKVNLFYRENLIQSTFTLPCAFSIRTNRVNAVNAGDVQAEPVFTIYNSGASVTLGDTYGIELVNHTTDQSILIERLFTDGETVVVNIPERIITSSTAGDITSSISQNSYLSNFWLLEGVNDVEVINHNVGDEISVVMEYDNQYIEAVF